MPPTAPQQQATAGRLHVTATNIRRVTHVAAAVILIAAGALVAALLSPEIGAALIASGVQQAVAAVLASPGSAETPVDWMAVSGPRQRTRAALAL